MNISITFTTDHLKPEDTDMIFVGSGALSHSWYQGIDWSSNHHGNGEVAEWWVTFVDEEDTHNYLTGRPFEHKRLDHETILSAVKTILESNGEGLGVSSECYQQCMYLITNVDQELVDFDADTADQVMQVATWGKVIYG